MCGIGAILGWRGSRGALDQAIRRMWDALAHRGPDDADLWISPDGTAALCHRRLSILDLSPAGRQPMVSSSGHLRIVFNGEIYNFPTLREELGADGFIFRGHSDTEVILAGFERHGEAFIGRLEGMFALVIHDDLTGAAWLARDSFGIKPLYHSTQSGPLFIASELRALLATGQIPRQLSGEGLDSFLRTGSVTEPHTLIQGITPFPAATVAAWKPAEPLRHQRYWQPGFTDSAFPDPEEPTRLALQDSVRRHLISDVPVGIFLSGGLDSFAVAALAAKESRLASYSIGVDDPHRDESREAAESARHLGLAHHAFTLRAADAADFFEDYLAAQDQPSIDGFNTYCIARFAWQAGAKVVLSGIGGDEFFGGYGSFQRAPRFARLGQRLGNGAFPATVAGRMLERWGTSPKLQRVGAWLQRPATLASSLHLVRGIFSAAESRRIAARFGVDPGEPPPDETPAAPTPEDAIGLLEIQGYLLNQLLRDSDTQTMAHGLELRLPLVDRPLFQTLSGIPARQRFQPGKSLLARAVGPLPEHLRGGGKKGFLFPFDQWLSTPPWQNRIREICARHSLPAAPWYRVWALLALESWMQRHLQK